MPDALVGVKVAEEDDRRNQPRALPQALRKAWS
jgi:hypothetical protein